MANLDSNVVTQVSKALNTLVANFKDLIGTGCNGNCGHCPFGRVINKEGECYKHGGCQITGEATLCDLLGILSDKAKK